MNSHSEVAKLTEKWDTDVRDMDQDDEYGLGYSDGKRHARADLKAALAQDRASQGAAAGVPEGWRMVPVEPTPAMCEAGGDAQVEHGGPNWTYASDAAVAYTAMLAAAPSAPVQGAEREVR